jgi:hypothetical protein
MSWHNIRQNIDTPELIGLNRKVKVIKWKKDSVRKEKK